MLLTQVRSIWVPQNWLWASSVVLGACVACALPVWHGITSAFILFCSVWSTLELCQAAGDLIFYPQDAGQQARELRLDRAASPIGFSCVAFATVLVWTLSHIALACLLAVR
jgi:hypothetical protein